MCGDLHGEITPLSNKRILSLCGEEFPQNLIVAGDFGFVWHKNKQEEYYLKWLEEKPYNIIVVKGNHENHERLLSDEFPTVNFNGAKAKQIRRNIFVIEHGEIFVLDGKSFFCMGGAMSVDKETRRNRIDWWQEEQPNYNDFLSGKYNLLTYGNRVNYIVSHSCPGVIYDKFLRNEFPDKQNDAVYDLLDYFYCNIQFDTWFCGHFHIDRFAKLNDKAPPVVFMYNSMRKIGKGFEPDDKTKEIIYHLERMKEVEARP